MPTTLDFGIVVPASDLEPNDLYGVSTRLGESTVEALARPYVYIHAAAATSIANSSAGTKVNLATTYHNDADYFGVASSVITILQDGIYRATAFLTGLATTGTAGLREAWIAKNGLTTNALADHAVGSQDAFACTLHADMEPLLEGDTLQLGFAQVSGAARNTRHDAFYVSRLVVAKIG